MPDNERELEPGENGNPNEATDAGDEQANTGTAPGSGSDGGAMPGGTGGDTSGTGR